MPDRSRTYLRPVLGEGAPLLSTSIKGRGTTPILGWTDTSRPLPPWTNPKFHSEGSGLHNFVKEQPHRKNSVQLSVHDTGSLRRTRQCRSNFVTRAVNGFLSRVMTDEDLKQFLFTVPRGSTQYVSGWPLGLLHMGHYRHADNMTAFQCFGTPPPRRPPFEQNTMNHVDTERGIGAVLFQLGLKIWAAHIGHFRYVKPGFGCFWVPANRRWLPSDRRSHLLIRHDNIWGRSQADQVVFRQKCTADNTDPTT